MWYIRSILGDSVDWKDCPQKMRCAYLYYYYPSNLVNNNMNGEEVWRIWTNYEYHRKVRNKLTLSQGTTSNEHQPNAFDFIFFECVCHYYHSVTNSTNVTTGNGFLISIFSKNLSYFYFMFSSNRLNQSLFASAYSPNHANCAPTKYSYQPRSSFVQNGRNINKTNKIEGNPFDQKRNA